MELKISYKLIEKITKITLFSISLFGYGVIASFVNDSSASRLVTVPFRVLVLVLSTAFLLLQAKSSSNKKNVKILPINPKISIFIITIFIFIYCFRLFFDIGYNQFLTRESNEYFLNWFFISLIPGITFIFLDSKLSKQYLYFSWILLLLGSALALPLIFQGQLSKTFVEQGRLAGEALNPISLGHQGGSLVLITIYILGNRLYSKNKFMTTAYICAVLLGIILLIFAASRGPIIAVALCISLLLFCNLNNRNNIVKLFIITFVILIFVNYTFLFALDSGGSLLERFGGLLNGDDLYSTRFVQRPELYQEAIKLIAEQPIFGYGLEVPNLGYPHNLILEAFLATGLLGGSLFLIIYIYAVIKAIRVIMSKNKSWNWLGLLFIQYAIAVMFSGALYSSYTFWYLLFAILGLKKSMLNKAY